MTDFLLELLQQPDAVISTAAYYQTDEGKGALADIAAALKNHSHILAIGMGSSNYLAQSMSLMLASRGITVTAVNAGDFLHYGINSVTDNTLVIAISQSGESYETVNVARQLRNMGVKARLAVITNETESTLATMCDILLPTVAGPEEKTSSKTFITAYQVIYSIASVLDGHTVGADVWNEMAQNIRDILDARETIAKPMLDILGDAGYLQVISRGTTMCSASQCALMAMEASHTPAQALSGGEFRHGPLEMVGEGFTAIVMSHTRSVTFDQSLRLIKDIISYGGKVLLVTDNCQTVEPARSLAVVEAPCCSEELFAMTSIIPVQIAIEAWARSAKGIVPGEFLHGAKVTAIE